MLYGGLLDESNIRSIEWVVPQWSGHVATALSAATELDRPTRADLAALIATHTTMTPPTGFDLELQPGRVVGLEGAFGTGLTRLGLSLIALPALRAPVAVVDTRGWLSPLAAWEVGIEPRRLSVVRCEDKAYWSQVVAALVAGMSAVYAEVPAGVPDSVLRRLASMARRERTGLVLRPLTGRLPSGVGHLRVRVDTVVWEGPDKGHGRLGRRSLLVEASGKAMAGMERRFEVEDDGEGAVHLVGGLAASSAGRVAG